MFGLKDTDIMDIQEVLQRFPEVQSAFLFGSRAKDNYRNGSDVDLALKGDNLSYSTLIRISGVLNEETLMPYHFDVLDYHSINNDNLKAHIDRVGKVLYERLTVPME